jgi:hypothetical protein
MSKGRKTRKRPLLLLALCFILLLFLPGSCDATLLDVVVNLRNAEAVDPALLPSSALASSVMDNSDLFVAVCSPGTFSPDDGGVCHECQGCHVEQFETLPCLPYRDRGCANCTVCDEHEVEVCQCSVKTSQCFTGDRVCLKLKPTTVTLTVELKSANTLSSRQEQLISAGLATGFVDWLVEEFATPSVEFVAMVRTAPGVYAATFTFHDVYSQTTIMRLKTQNPSLYQRGLVYTFGGTLRRRRSLLAYTSDLVSATGSHSDCLTNTTYDGPYLAFQFFNESGCGGTCVGVPCPVGLFGGFGHCADCSPGSYADAVGMTVCAPCPDGLSSPPRGQRLRPLLRGPHDARADDHGPCADNGSHAPCLDDRRHHDHLPHDDDDDRNDHHGADSSDDHYHDCRATQHHRGSCYLDGATQYHHHGGGASCCSHNHRCLGRGRHGLK